MMIGVISSAGIPEYILAYRKENEQQVYKAAFWFNAALTLGVLVVFFIALPFWARANNDNRIITIGIITGIYFLFSQLQSIPKTILSRQLDFKSVVRIQNPFIVLIPLGKIACAYLGFGVYSLVVPTAVFTAIQGIFFFKESRFMPGIDPIFKRWPGIFQFSRNLIGTMIISRISTEGDKLILAGVLGLELLGVYTMAFNLANFFPSNVLNVSNTVLSATMPKFAHSYDVLRAKFYSFLQVFGFLSVPIQVLLILIAPYLVVLMYGETWSAVTVPFQILSLFAIMRCLTSPIGSLLNSIGQPQVAFGLVLVYTPLHLAASYMGSRFGVEGLALAVVFLKFAYTPIEMTIVLKRVNGSLREWADRLSELFVQNGVTLLFMLPVAYGVSVVTLPVVVKLILVVAAFAAIHYFVLRLLYMDYLRQLQSKVGALNERFSFYFGRLFQLT